MTDLKGPSGGNEHFANDKRMFEFISSLSTKATLSIYESRPDSGFFFLVKAGFLKKSAFFFCIVFSAYNECTPDPLAVPVFYVLST